MRAIFLKMTEVVSFFRGLVVSTIRNNESKLAAALRSRAYGATGTIDTGVIVTNRQNLKLGQHSHLYHACYVLNDNGRLGLGDNSHLGAFCYVNALFGAVEIGDNVAVGPGTKIFSYSNHYRKGSLVTNEKKLGDIRIGNNVFIGANCTVLPGTIIEDNVVVGAGSVIKGRLKTDAIYGGVPCKEINTGWYS